MSTYDLFISYANEDKDDIAEPLANGLMQAGLSVWFDETCISIGDSIFSAINEGLKRSRFALVILSPAYLQKQWTVAELQALFDIEVAKKSKHILPVWHNINQAYLRKNCPLLIDKVGISSSQRFSELINRIYSVVKSNQQEAILVPPPDAQEKVSEKIIGKFVQNVRNNSVGGSLFTIQGENINITIPNDK